MSKIINSLFVNSNKPLDEKWGPYKNIDECKKALPGGTIDENSGMELSGVRYQGLTVGIRQEDGTIKEYWFKDGITNDDLKEKNIEDITELKIDGNQIEKTTFLFSSDLENSESPLMSKINTQISENIQNDTNLQNRVNEAVENSIQNSDTITNAINLGIQENSTITKFNNLLDGENIKLDALPTGLRELPNNFENGVIKDSVLPTGLQKFTSNLSNDGKISTLDVLPTGVITSSNINDNLPDTIARKDDLSDLEGTINGLQTTVAGKANVNDLNNLQNIAVTINNINEKLPDTIARKDDLSGLVNTKDLFDNGKLKDTYIPTTLATKDALNNLSNSVVLQTDDTYTSLQNIKNNLTALSSVKDKIIDENNNVKFATYDNIKSGLLNDTGFNNSVASKITEDINKISPETIADNIINNKSAELIGSITSNSNFMSTLANNDDLTNKIINNNDFGRETLIEKVKETLISYGESELSETLTDRTNAIKDFNISGLQSAKDEKLTAINSVDVEELQSTRASKLTAINSVDVEELQSTRTNKLNEITQIQIKPSEVAEYMDTTEIANAIQLTDKISDYVNKQEFAKQSDITTLQGTMTGLQSTVANKADSSALTTLQKSVGTLNSRTLSNKTGFVNIENNNIDKSNLDLIYNSISDARISSDEVAIKLNPMETGYYYFIVNIYDNIRDINNTLKAKLDENELYNFVYIDGEHEKVTEYNYELSISNLFEKLDLKYGKDLKYAVDENYKKVHLGENVFEVLLNKLLELGLNDYYNYLSNLTENIKIYRNDNRFQTKSETGFYNLSLAWVEISKVLQIYNRIEYYLTIKDDKNNLTPEFITFFEMKNDGYKTNDPDINNNSLISNFLLFIENEISSKNSPFYQYLIDNLKDINLNNLLKNNTFFKLNKNNQIDCQDVSILKLTIDYFKKFKSNDNTDLTISGIIDFHYDENFHVDSRKYLEFFGNIETDENYKIDHYSIYLNDFYNTLIELCNSENDNSNLYIKTSIFDNGILNKNLSRYIKLCLDSNQNVWEGYSTSYETNLYKNINNDSVSQYIVKDDEIIELPYKFKLNSDDELINWLNTYIDKCNSYLTYHDENDLIYFGSENDIDVLINSYTYHIIPDAFQLINDEYELKYLTFDEVKSYINNLSDKEKVKKIFLSLKYDNGYQYIFTQYVLNNDVLMTFQEDYIVQYAPSFISQLVNTGGVTVGGKQINFAKTEDVSNLTINSETNMEVVAQLVNGLIEDLTLIAQKVSLTDEEKANLSVIDLTGTTGKLTYDVTNGTYKSVKIEGNTPINPRHVTSL